MQLPPSELIVHPLKWVIYPPSEVVDQVLLLLGCGEILLSFLGVLISPGAIGFGWIHTIRRGLRLHVARVKIQVVNNAGGTGRMILRCGMLVFRAHKIYSSGSGPAMDHSTMHPFLALPMMYASRGLHKVQLVFQGGH